MAGNTLSSPGEIKKLTDKLIDMLKTKGVDASPLDEVQSTAFTTGSEWQGELTAALKKVKSFLENRDSEISKCLSRLLKAVAR